MVEYYTCSVACRWWTSGTERNRTCFEDKANSIHKKVNFFFFCFVNDVV